MSNYDLGLLITLDIGLAIIGILGITAGLTIMRIVMGRQLREIQTTGERVARLVKRVDAQLLRQYLDIDSDLGG